ncbi:electron transfer flavoprotein subunit alpha/FixB family protein [Lapidilactobacillus achengensis]|uniref:Electron transfer flavoprotein subunit alpha/FixB family protein n=1 Tax=Lapidilactobacillus achengensis TaxID=2486000 RepID=A0ABW1URC4_9LACO|nr:electron transfer flavoprotein subunit alpha/FixB family protein [Lapidilactobacillus achengensis]
MTKIPEVWIFAEHQQNQIEPTVLQLISKAQAIAPTFKVVAVLLEAPDQQLEQTLAAYGPDQILAVKQSQLEQVADVEQAMILQQLVQARQPNSFLFGATALGRSLAPRLQAKLQTGLTADCLDLYFEDELLVQVKPSYGDNIMCEITCPERRPQMATVRPNTFAAVPVEADQVCQEIEVLTDLTWPKVAHFDILNEQVIPTPPASLAQADRIVALGRGAADPASVATARQLTAALNAQLGVTRPLTDDPQFAVSNQIGQSGQTVAPELLFCCGISGAVQFLTGITQAQTVVAINSDAQAAIFGVADYGFVGDAKAFMTALNHALLAKNA